MPFVTRYGKVSDEADMREEVIDYTVTYLNQSTGQSGCGARVEHRTHSCGNVDDARNLTIKGKLKRRDHVLNTDAVTSRFVPIDLKQQTALCMLHRVIKIHDARLRFQARAHGSRCGNEIIIRMMRLAIDLSHNR